MDVLDTLIAIGLLVATIVVAGATVALWRSTNAYAKSTEEYVQLARRSLQIVEAGSAPRLTIQKGGRSSVGSQPGTAEMQGILVVKNVGGGVANDVTLVTSWGDAKVKAPTLAPDEKSEARPAIPRKDWDEHKRKGEPVDPVPDRVRFSDVQGKLHDVEVQEISAGRIWVVPIPPPG